MSDLISRQAAIDAIKREQSLIERPITETRWFDLGLRKAQDVLSELSSAQPEPKTARWVNVNEGKWNTVEVLKCTACGEIDNRMYRTDGYCPNCGAKMEVNTEK